MGTLLTPPQAVPLCGYCSHPVQALMPQPRQPLHRQTPPPPAIALTPRTGCIPCAPCSLYSTKALTLSIRMCHTDALLTPFRLCYHYPLTLALLCCTYGPWSQDLSGRGRKREGKGKEEGKVRAYTLKTAHISLGVCMCWPCMAKRDHKIH